MHTLSLTFTDHCRWHSLLHSFLTHSLTHSLIALTSLLHSLPDTHFTSLFHSFITSPHSLLTSPHFSHSSFHLQLLVENQVVDASTVKNMRLFLDGATTLFAMVHKRAYAF